MSSSNKDRYYGSSSVAKSRRSSPGDSQNSVFFQGQGGRTVLPPISSAFPTSRFPVPTTYSNQYTQPRSSPGRYDLNPAFYSQWPQSNSPQLSPSFPNYETHDRYSTQQSYTAYPSRSPPPGAILSNPGESRRLPPLATSANVGAERWQQQSYPVSSVQGYPGNNIRSPTASYPSAYMPYSGGHAPAYSYHMPTQEHMPMDSQGHPGHGLFDDMEGHRGDPRPSSTYSRASSSQMPPTSYTPPPISPISPDEPTIKKKRKRADAAQLKVLNETYARTAFPSTEERAALAKQLDMTARSVQIWFQNKRQSMRQTNRQSSSAGTSHQSFAMPNQADPMIDDLHASSGYGGHMQMTEPYISGSSRDAGRPHTSHSHHPQSHPSSAHAHGGVVVDQRKWRGY